MKINPIPPKELAKVAKLPLMRIFDILEASKLLYKIKLPSSQTGKSNSAKTTSIRYSQGNKLASTLSAPILVESFPYSSAPQTEGLKRPVETLFLLQSLLND